MLSTNCSKSKSGVNSTSTTVTQCAAFRMFILSRRSQKGTQGLAHKSRWCTFAEFSFLYVLIAFSFYQLYHFIRYGTVLPLLRRYHHYISYSGHEIIFVLSVIVWLFIFLFWSIVIAFHFGLDRYSKHRYSKRWRKSVERGVMAELTRTRLRFEDQDVVEPYDRK